MTDKEWALAQIQWAEHHARVYPDGPGICGFHIGWAHRIYANAVREEQEKDDG